MCILQTSKIRQRVYLQRTEFWRSWNEEMINTNGQSSKSRWKKWGHLSSYHVCSRRYGHENVKNGSFFVFSANNSKISRSLEKIFTCIWKIVFSTFRRCYGLLHSELPLAIYQPLKIQNFIIFLVTQHFFYISILNNSRTVTPKAERT